MIKLTGLNKHYGSHHALSDINLAINAGEIFGIIGKSGAGKSTLLRCINLLERPDSGAISVNQQDMLALTPQALREARHQIGMIFQHFNLLQAKTVFENIALPLRIQGASDAHIKKRVDELLALVELSNKAGAYPAALSGGQKQRVAIARALSSEPKVLLCDEATSALDPETTKAILALLKKINHEYGITIVLITHEMDVVKQLAHRVALMEAGRITEIVALNTLFSKP
ncbi:MAG: ATP-binding cassette domain-containing protein, partial [Legionella sp.]|nr:ATP-binding cassette domain-containing protein [Legionella sp.]